MCSPDTLACAIVRALSGRREDSIIGARSRRALRGRVGTGRDSRGYRGSR